MRRAAGKEGRGWGEREETITGADDEHPAVFLPSEMDFGWPNPRRTAQGKRKRPRVDELAYVIEK